MKIITYEEWLRNPTPRMMWVWDVNKKDKVQRKVVYVVRGEPSDYPVITVVSDETTMALYRHCAEIEEPKTRRMTNKELSRWLREHSSREYKYQTSDYIYSAFNYRECKQDEEVHKDIRIREDDGDWKEPLVEV